jgi:hypothetical protein
MHCQALFFCSGTVCWHFLSQVCFLVLLPTAAVATAAVAAAAAGYVARPGKELRAQGLNRIGNMLVPNSNYCLFEDWIMPILDQMLLEQKEQGVVWTPSKVSRWNCLEICVCCYLPSVTPLLHPAADEHASAGQHHPWHSNRQQAVRRGG